MTKTKTLKIACLLSLCALLFSAREDRVHHGTGTWDATAFGNHRAVIRVAQQADAVFVRIPWRRRDLDPEKKHIVLMDAATQRQVRNVVRLEINREFGDLAFQPVSGPGEYQVYYLPNRMEGRSNYPTVT
jgi:hypothetical protein